ncbi:MAG TPA: tRNA uridine-5-carboxymethylaminomethyl(34) synthesis GTPase MnmE [Chthoniobacteraceae bacterium]|nr:tRNA uridine-5-carboxymethylaminomethyl(34) synthesis GTPase MnmE [Chthoniobacteraceae bacterium]
MTDTIAAISTPFGEGAIALLRLSGPRAVEVADAVFQAGKAVAELPARQAQFGAVYDGKRKLDDVVLTVFRGPHSYTGEDVVEIGCHGGVLVSRRILELLLRNGARVAEPGEFTQRAYLHGKMDLTQAEAVMDLISAQTDLALRAAAEQLEGRLGERFRVLRERLIEVLAHVEAFIDFPDEDIDPATGDALLAKIDSVRAEVASLLDTAGAGRVLRQGVRTVIYGAPNVGKSSLLNLLLGYERAIVSSRPGTTRDVIEETINLHGIPLRLVDTAGVRDSEDEIERAGMERTQRQVERADLVLHVADASEGISDFKFQDSDLKSRTVLVLNKIDLGEHASWSGVEGVRISCLKNQGLETLAAVIEARVFGGPAAHRDWSVAINARHEAALERAQGFANAARQALLADISPEFVAEELRGALEAIGDVLGRVDHDEVLGKIFSSFCIGK